MFFQTFYDVILTHRNLLLIPTPFVTLYMLKAEQHLCDLLDTLEYSDGHIWEYREGWDYYGGNTSIGKPIISYNIVVTADDDQVLLLSQVPKTSGLEMTQKAADLHVTTAYENVIEYLKGQNSYVIIERALVDKKATFISNLSFPT